MFRGRIVKSQKKPTQPKVMKASKSLIAAALAGAFAAGTLASAATFVPGDKEKDKCPGKDKDKDKEEETVVTGDKEKDKCPGKDKDKDKEKEEEETIL